MDTFGQMFGQGGGDDHDEYPYYGDGWYLLGPHLPPGPFFKVLRYLDAKSLGSYSQVEVDNMRYSEGVRSAIRDDLIVKHEEALRKLYASREFAHRRSRLL